MPLVCKKYLTYMQKFLIVEESTFSNVQTIILKIKVVHNLAQRYNKNLRVCFFLMYTTNGTTILPGHFSNGVNSIFKVSILKLTIRWYIKIEYIDPSLNVTRCVT